MALPPLPNKQPELNIMTTPTRFKKSTQPTADRNSNLNDAQPEKKTLPYLQLVQTNSKIAKKYPEYIGKYSCKFDNLGDALVIAVVDVNRYWLSRYVPGQMQKRYKTLDEAKNDKNEGFLDACDLTICLMLESKTPDTVGEIDGMHLLPCVFSVKSNAYKLVYRQIFSLANEHHGENIQAGIYSLCVNKKQFTNADGDVTVYYEPIVDSIGELSDAEQSTVKNAVKKYLK